MSRLIVCSEADLPSVNMRASLLSQGGWEDMGSSEGVSYMRREDDVMMSIADMHIRHEDLDLEAARFGVDPDYVVVMSRHSSKSGRPALTAHPIGNYHEADFGGRAETLVRSAPAAMTDAVRRIHALNSDPSVQTCFEVTHHGPWLGKPTFYIEIGSDETHWGDKHLAEVLAHVIADLEPHDEYRGKYLPPPYIPPALPPYGYPYFPPYGAPYAPPPVYPQDPPEPFGEFGTENKDGESGGSADGADEENKDNTDATEGKDNAARG